MKTLALAALSAASFALLALAAPTSAQEALSMEIREAFLPEEYEEQLLEIFEDPSSARFVGRATVGSGEVIRGDVAAIEGPLRIAGEVRGTVAMLRGDVIVERGGEVEGDIVVVGGRVRISEGGVVSGGISEFSEPTTRSRTAREADWAVGEWSEAGAWHSMGRGERGSERGFARMGFGVASQYNRVEGLPIGFGPTLRTAGPHPLRLDARIFWRTAAEPALGLEEWGYRAGLRQTLGWGPRFQFGGSVYSQVAHLDDWQMSDSESGWATALFTQDFRDHYGLEGWSAFVGMNPAPGLDLTVEYRDADHTSLGVADPWTLFRGDHMWRLQPLVAEGRFQSVAGRIELDRRPRRDAPGSGWFAQVEVERGVGGDLTRPALSGIFPESGGVPGDAPLSDVAARDFATDFTTAFADVRRYARVGDGSELGLRVVGGGNMDRAPLPPQFQHALGGPGSLPGFSPFSADCGARSEVGSRTADGRGTAYYPSYGCDRFVMGQVEYRGRLDFGFDVDHDRPDRRDGDDRGNSRSGDRDRADRNDRGDRDRDRRDGWNREVDDLGPRWILFFDAAKGWTYGPGLPDDGLATDVLYDAGAGFMLGDLGVYFAVPLTSGVERDARFFVRLQRRF